MPEEQRPKPNTTVTNSSGQEWESNALHGKYPQRVKQADVDQDKTHRWLKAADLKAETEGFIIAAQDQSLLRSWYQQNILTNDPKSVTEKDSITILWDMPIHIDKTIAANRPDILLKNKKDKTCLLIDMTIPLDTNTSVKRQRLGNRGSANVGAQNNNSRGGYGSP